MRSRGLNSLPLMKLGKHYNVSFTVYFALCNSLYASKNVVHRVMRMLGKRQILYVFIGVSY